MKDFERFGFVLFDPNPTDPNASNKGMDFVTTVEGRPIERLENALRHAFDFVDGLESSAGGHNSLVVMDAASSVTYSKEVNDEGQIYWTNGCDGIKWYQTEDGGYLPIRASNGYGK